MTEPILPVVWTGDYVILLDQRALPNEERYLEIRSAREMWQAIRDLAVRGAPAIGIAAAYGVMAEMARHRKEDTKAFAQALEESIAYLRTSRPTAVNLFWALDQMAAAGREAQGADNGTLWQVLLEKAREIEKGEEDSCLRIGEGFLSFLKEGMTLLTHCNAGGIATRRYGTALAPVLLGAERGIRFKVYADETRPLLQGARLTTWELMKAGVDVTLITDNMAGMVMQQGKIDAVIVGCDRIAANGDVVNKIGTYGVAVLARHHGIPFYVAAPVSTIDLATATGAEIPIEERNGDEITRGFGRQTAPDGMKTYNPAFDCTPAELVTAIVTNEGILYPPYPEGLQKLMENKEKKNPGKIAEVDPC